MPFLSRLLVLGRLGVAELILATERLLHQTVAVLQQVGTKLTTGA